VAFQSFDTARSGASNEAQVVREQFETVQLFPIGVRARLSGELVCYARTVVRQEWPKMESGTLGDRLNPWTLAMFRITKTVEPRSASEQAAYAKWLDQRTDREAARADRTHGAEGVIPTPLWIVLLLSALIIFAYMLFFADSAERVVVQAMMMGGVAVVITSTLLLLWFLDHPYHSSVGSLRPVAMERTIRILDEEAAAIGERPTIPCDDRGKPRGA